MKANYIKIVKCEHCQKDFTLSRSDHKFCSTSCRSASHSLIKRMVNKKGQLLIDKISVVENTVLPYNLPDVQEGYKPSFLKDTASASLAPLLFEIIKSMKGVNNSDIMKAIIKNQAGLIELNQEIKSIKEEIKLKDSQLDKKQLPSEEGFTILN